MHYNLPSHTERGAGEEKKNSETKKKTKRSRGDNGDGGTERRSNNEDGAPGAAWKVAEAASCLF